MIRWGLCLTTNISKTCVVSVNMRMLTLAAGGWESQNEHSAVTAVGNAKASPQQS